MKALALATIVLATLASNAVADGSGNQESVTATPYPTVEAVIERLRAEARPETDPWLRWLRAGERDGVLTLAVQRCLEDGERRLCSTNIDGYLARCSRSLGTEQCLDSLRRQTPR